MTPTEKRFKFQYLGLKSSKSFETVRAVIEKFIESGKPILSVEFVPCYELIILQGKLNLRDKQLERITSELEAYIEMGWSIAAAKETLADIEAMEKELK